MFSIPHLIIIFVVVLVVFGPEKLPDLARNLGKIMGEFRRATGDLQHTFEDHLRDIERESSMRRESTGTGTTIAPGEQNTIGQPKAAATGATGTVAADAPHGWTVAPGTASAQEDAESTASSAPETSGATQAEVTEAQLHAPEASGTGLTGQELHGERVTQSQLTQPQGTQDQKTTTDPGEPQHPKESDGGTSPN